MGSRANLVVIRERRTRFFYDHWGGDQLDVEVFWGPEMTLDYIEHLPPKADHIWLDSSGCEGGAVVDVDNKTLIFFGGTEVEWNVSLRRQYMALLRAMWCGWDVRWADDGIISLGRYLGIGASSFCRRIEPDPLDRFYCDNEFPSSNKTLVTIHRQGRTSTLKVSGDMESIELGPEHVDLSSLESTGRIGAWEGDFPIGGVHFDLDRLSLAHWWAEPTYIGQNVEKAWPDWTVTPLGDCFDRHLQLAGIEGFLSVQPPAVLQRNYLQYLRSKCIESAAISVDALDRQLDLAAGLDRGSVMEEKSRKLAILDQLEEQIPIAAEAEA